MIYFRMDIVIVLVDNMDFRMGTVTMLVDHGI